MDTSGVFIKATKPARAPYSRLSAIRDFRKLIEVLVGRRPQQLAT
jgi:hypothetical protein